MSSCDHKELEFEGSTDLNVSFDWSGASLATPQQMRLVVFKDEAQPLEIPFAPEGGATHLNIGNYRFIAYNSESEVLSAGGGDYESFAIYARSTTLSRFSTMFANTRQIPRAESTEDQDIVFSPDELWTSAVQKSIHSSTRTLSMPMEPATIEYVFVIQNVHNLNNVQEVTATISGMSSSWIPSQGRCSDTHCIMPFEVESDGESTITARVRCFGHCPDAGHSSHKLMVYAMLNDYSKWYYTFDITEDMHDPDHYDTTTGEGRNPEVPIVLDDLPLPEPVPAEGMGLTPQVDTWQEVTIEKIL